MILGDHMTGSADRFLLPGLLLVAGVLAAWFGVRLWRRYWVVVDTPTSACGAVFVGRNEVVGRAQPHVQLTAPVTGQPCVWFRWKLERYVRSDNGGHWTTLEERSTSAPFWVVDDTGAVLVRPRDAEVDVPRAVEWRADRCGLWASQHDLRMASFQGSDPEEHARTWASVSRERPAPTTPIGSLGRNHRISEWHVTPGQELYVLGPASLRHDAAALELAGRHGPEGLLISTRSEAQVGRASRNRAFVGLLLGFAAAVLAPALFSLLSVEERTHDLAPSRGANGFQTVVMLLIVAGGAWNYFQLLRSPQASAGQACLAFALMAVWPLWYTRFHYGDVAESSRSLADVAGRGVLLGGLLYLAFLASLYWVRLYNRLVAVKQQAAAAWSLIDVALRRRHDLLPQLVTVTAEYAKHEREVLDAVAGQRLDQALAPPEALPSDATLRSAGEVNRREAHGAHALLAVAEAYPALQADQVFQDLARRITQTEDHVAYARRFYNDAVTVLRDRRRTFPGLLVAPFVATPSWHLFDGSADADHGLRSPLTESRL